LRLTTAPAPYDQTKPENGNGNGADENGDDDDESNGDRINLAEAQRQRDAAYRSQYDQQKWKNPSNPYSSNGSLSGQNNGVLDPTTASAIQGQGVRWRHGA
jgi:hypothetical protein